MWECESEILFIVTGSATSKGVLWVNIHTGQHKQPGYKGIVVECESIWNQLTAVMGVLGFSFPTINSFLSPLSTMWPNGERSYRMESDLNTKELSQSHEIIKSLLPSASTRSKGVITPSPK